MGPPKLKGACGFCHLREQTLESGILYKSPDDEVAAHFNCMLFSPMLVTQNTPHHNSLGGFLPEHVKKEIKRGRRLKCHTCKQTGATIGCDVPRCKRSYHYLCAKKSDAAIIEDEEHEVYKVYCVRHRPDRIQNANDRAENSNDIPVSTDDELTKDDMSNVTDDDGTCDEDNENDASIGQPEKNNGGILDTPKRNMLKRFKSSTPCGREINGSHSHLDLDTNNAAPGSSGVAEHLPNSQHYIRNVGTMTTSGPNRKRTRIDSDSSGSSTSILVNRPLQTCTGALSDINDMVENADPNWIMLLSKYCKQIQADDDGQTNVINAKDFWKLSGVANCTEALFEKMKTSIETNLMHIQSDTASEEDYEHAFQLLLATGCLQTIARDLKEEIRNEKEAHEREAANLRLKEQLLETILPTLNKSNSSAVLDATAENAIHGYPE
ncbi:PHD finger protein 11 isoform X2 [Ambystoma mexicanum]|uniref:PHD finger protein 11 isoform X2 n=1 Tax=Ambystoma mexicanum TaxID=8296 RepID=UPI0037E85BBE